MDGDVPPLDKLWELKIEYGFILYCDEAHSFLSIGSTGMGCLQYWNETHPTKSVPWDLIDIRTGTLSKSIGGIGGFIVGKSSLEECIRQHVHGMEPSDQLSIPSSTMVQALMVLGQPERISHNLHRLAAISQFCRAELTRFGVYVYGDETGTPILPVWAGRPSTSARLSYAFRTEGLLASPVTTPAVPFWESRVRINLSADYTDDNVDRLIDTIIAGALSTGICKRRPMVCRRRFSTLRGSWLSHEASESEMAATSSATRKLIQQSSEMLDDACNPKYQSSNPAPSLEPEAIAAGHASRSLYGVGAGSARWISGTFPPHLKVEKLLAELQGAESAMTYADAEIGLASTIAALARPVLGCKRHYMLFPQNATGPVRDGLVLIPPKGKEVPQIMGYKDIRCIPSLIEKLAKPKVCFTVYVPTQDVLIVDCIIPAARGCPVTALLHSPAKLVDLPGLGFGRHSPCEDSSNDKSCQILVYGSFSQAFGLPGGYLAGSEAMIRELRYTSRGYMYTTSTAPFVMDMVRVALEKGVNRYV